MSVAELSDLELNALAQSFKINTEGVARKVIVKKIEQHIAASKKADEEAKANAKESNGQKGRPVVEGSARQIRLAELEARKLANGGVVKRGRPAAEGSDRQMKLAARSAKLALGLEVKPGRPKVINIDVKAPKTEPTTEAVSTNVETEN